MQALTLDSDSRPPLRLGGNTADAMAEIAFDFEHPYHLPPMGIFGRYCQVEQNLPVSRKDSAGSETENQ